MSAPEQQVKQIQAITNPLELEVVLAALLIGKTDIVKHVTKLLNKFCKTEQCIPALMQQVLGSINPSVRQVAGVTMRCRIKDLWQKIVQSGRESIKAALLQAITKEPTYVDRCFFQMHCCRAGQSNALLC